MDTIITTEAAAENFSKVPGMTDSATILKIQVGKPKSVATQPDGKAWLTGFQKLAVSGPVWLSRLNFAGDGQADLKHHGGPDKAVCVYPDSHYPQWQSELGLDLAAGSFGENLTVAGLVEEHVCIGDFWEIGDAKVQVSQPRQPCWKLSRWWNVEDLAVRVQQTGRTGWYLRVITEGNVEAGASIRFVDRTHSDWTIAAANQLMHHDKDNVAAAATLANVPELSASWRETLTKRSQKRKGVAPENRLYGTES